MRGTGLGEDKRSSSALGISAPSQPGGGQDSGVPCWCPAVPSCALASASINL